MPELLSITYSVTLRYSSVLLLALIYQMSVEIGAESGVKKILLHQSLLDIHEIWQIPVYQRAGC